MKKMLPLFILLLVISAFGQKLPTKTKPKTTEPIVSKDESKPKPPIIEIRAKTEDGKSVILRSDGTWDYSLATPTSETQKKSVKVRTLDELKEMALKSPFQIVVKYDEFKDETTVLLKPISIPTNKSFSLNFSIAFQFKGKEFKGSPDFLTLFFNSVTKDWEFLTSNDLIFLVDGERLSIGKAIRSNDVGLGYVSESLFYLLKPEQSQKLMAANKLRFQIGLTEGTFDSEALEALKSLLEMTGQSSR